MKAPDSLWVAAQWHSQEKKMGLYAFASAEGTSHPDKEKYIRKEAILEWAEMYVRAGFEIDPQFLINYIESL